MTKKPKIITSATAWIQPLEINMVLLEVWFINFYRCFERLMVLVQNRTMSNAACTDNPSLRSYRDRQNFALSRQFFPGGLQPFDENPSDPFHQLVTEFMVALALLAQARAIVKYGFDRRHSVRVEVRIIRRKEPRPAQHAARADGFDQHRAVLVVALRAWRFQCYFAA